MSVRVRGIYATALTKLFLDHGFKIANPTNIILKRFNLNPSIISDAADATVKNLDDDPSTLLVLGFPEVANKVLEIMKEKIPEVVIRKAPIGLYSVFKSVIKGIKDGECIVETPIGEGYLINKEKCEEGKEDFFTVVKTPITPKEKPIVAPGIKVVGYYAIVGTGRKVTFSEHIRDKKRMGELLEISAQYLREGYSVHWRSSAGRANLTSIMNELTLLIDKLNDIKLKFSKYRVGDIVSRGESLSFVSLSFKSKEILDSIRREVIPTTPLHHYLKSIEIFNDQNTYDLLDNLSLYIDRNSLRKGILSYILDRIKQCRYLKLRHIKLDGNYFDIGPGELIGLNKDLKEIKLRRYVHKPGIYDGLDIPKEEGDIIITKVYVDRYYLIHEYYSSEGKLKGLYININTLPEILPQKCCIKYFDLYVDIVKVNNKVKVTDLNDLCNAIGRELISNNLAINISTHIKKYLGMDIDIKCKNTN